MVSESELVFKYPHSVGNLSGFLARELESDGSGGFEKNEGFGSNSDLESIVLESLLGKLESMVSKSPLRDYDQASMVVPDTQSPETCELVIPNTQSPEICELFVPDTQSPENYEQLVPDPQSPHPWHGQQFELPESARAIIYELIYIIFPAYRHKFST